MVELRADSTGARARLDEDRPLEWSDELEQLVQAAVRQNNNLVRRLVHRHVDIEDILQMLRVKVWSSLPRYNSRYAITTFVYTVVHNELCSQIRFLSAKRRFGDVVTVSLDDDEYGVLARRLVDHSVEDPLRSAVYGELFDLLRDALSRRFPDVPADEFIHSLMEGRPLPGVGWRKRIRILKHLRYAMEQHYGGVEHVGKDR